MLVIAKKIYVFSLYLNKSNMYRKQIDLVWLTFRSKTVEFFIYQFRSTITQISLFEINFNYVTSKVPSFFYQSVFGINLTRSTHRFSCLTTFRVPKQRNLLQVVDTTKISLYCTPPSSTHTRLTARNGCFLT